MLKDCNLPDFPLLIMLNSTPAVWFANQFFFLVSVFFLLFFDWGKTLNRNSSLRTKRFIIIIVDGFLFVVSALFTGFVLIGEPKHQTVNSTLRHNKRENWNVTALKWSCVCPEKLKPISCWLLFLHCFQHFHTLKSTHSFSFFKWIGFERRKRLRQLWFVWVGPIFFLFLLSIREKDAHVIHC